MGTLSPKKTRMCLTIEKETKAQLEAAARDQNRSTNNLIITIISEYLKKGKTNG